MNKSLLNDLLTKPYSQTPLKAGRIGGNPKATQLRQKSTDAPITVRAIVLENIETDEGQTNKNKPFVSGSMKILNDRLKSYRTKGPPAKISIPNSSRKSSMNKLTKQSLLTQKNFAIAKKACSSVESYGDLLRNQTPNPVSGPSRLFRNNTI